MGEQGQTEPDLSFKTSDINSTQSNQKTYFTNVKGNKEKRRLAKAGDWLHRHRKAILFAAIGVIVIFIAAWFTVLMVATRNASTDNQGQSPLSSQDRVSVVADENNVQSAEISKITDDNLSPDGFGSLRSTVQAEARAFLNEDGNEPTRAINHYTTLINQALDNQSLTVAYMLVWLEHDDFVALGMDQAAYDGLRQVDIGRFEPQPQYQIYIALAELASKLGDQEQSIEYESRGYDAIGGKPTFSKKEES